MDALWTLAADPAAWAALLTLIVMEVVLGIDNLIFIAILTNRLPEDQRESARRIGIGLALVMRLALLGTIAIIVKLTEPVFSLLGQSFSWRDLILIAGGAFLVWKATKEIHHKVDPDPSPDVFDRKSVGLGWSAHSRSICDCGCLRELYEPGVGPVYGTVAGGRSNRRCGAYRRAERG